MLPLFLPLIKVVAAVPRLTVLSPSPVTLLPITISFVAAVPEALIA
jgi:hypothetical protein